MEGNDDQARALVAEAEAALDQIERLEGPASVAAGRAVEALVDLYGEVLGRVLDHVTHTPGSELYPAIVRDEAIGHVLIAHGLLPTPPEFVQEPEVQTTPVTLLGRKPAAQTP